MTDYLKQAVLSISAVGGSAIEVPLATDVAAGQAARIQAIKYSVLYGDVIMDAAGAFELSCNLALKDDYYAAVGAEASVLPFTYHQWLGSVVTSGGFGLSMSNLIIPPMDLIVPADSIYFGIYLAGDVTSFSPNPQVHVELLYDIKKTSTSTLFGLTLQYGL